MLYANKKKITKTNKPLVIIHYIYYIHKYTNAKPEIEKKNVEIVMKIG